MIFLERDDEYFRVEICKDLFGELNVVQYWGNARSRHEKHKVIPVDSIEQAGLVQELIVSGKLTNGFRVSG